MKDEVFRVSLSEEKDGILAPAGLPEGDYDQQAAGYDKLISNPLYNRIMWGNSPADYAAFLKLALTRHHEGLIADIGCGTLGFTAEVYRNFDGGDLFLCDLSGEMLHIGLERLRKGGRYPDGITFLRADALDLPFRDNKLSTVLCFGIYHIFENPELLLHELYRILLPGGRLFLTSLCTDRPFSARYLRLLHKKGHVATPAGSREIIDRISREGFVVDADRVRGGMLYVEARKPAI